MQVGGVFLNENMESRSVFYDKEASVSREKPLVKAQARKIAYWKLEDTIPLFSESWFHDGIAR